MDPKKYKVLKDFQIGESSFKEGQVIETSSEIASQAPEGALEIVVDPVPPAPTVQSSAPVPPAPPEGGEKTFTITMSDLKKVIEESQKPLLDKIGMLEQVADTKAMERWMMQHRKDVGVSVRLSTYKGKVITGWNVLEDTIQQDLNSGRWFEKQIMRVTFEDGTTIDVAYPQFTDMIRLTQVVAKVLEKREVTTEEGGKRIAFKVRREDNGQEYEIADSFVN